MFFKSKKPTLTFTLKDQCLSLQGQVDAESVAAFMKVWEVQKETNAAPIKRVDWADVTESDSTGLALMLTLRAQQADGFVLENLSAKLMTLLHLYDLDDVLDFTDATPQEVGC